jgi:hypothetical protein
VRRSSRMSRKRHHAKHLGFWFSRLITRRSLVQIQPPQPSFYSQNINVYAGFLYGSIAAEKIVQELYWQFA